MLFYFKYVNPNIKAVANASKINVRFMLSYCSFKVDYSKNVCMLYY